MSMLLITLVYFVRNQYLKQSSSCTEICGACPPCVIYDLMLDFLDMDFFCFCLFLNESGKIKSEHLDMSVVVVRPKLTENVTE